MRKTKFHRDRPRAEQERKPGAVEMEWDKNVPHVRGEAVAILFTFQKWLKYH